ncbi:hypothetical protein EJB05_19502 [Eragrostis curvula]|uniref:Myb/SANT-like domain-containing protein n=1 Tax=Eragrostis curvula TaxID=38414 RepID=A0A5J9UWM2_9POAL|nr:hypothetical protein EJB05_19502 [Eragrostis curvula]
MSEQSARAAWSFAYEKGLVDILSELKNDARFKGQNGWTSEGWKTAHAKFNQQFPLARFTKQQLQEKEKEVKASYRAIRDAKKESGIGWNEVMGMITTTDPEIWKKCVAKYPKIKKHEKKGFPLFRRCEVLYEGSIATGDLCFTSTDPVVQPTHLPTESLQLAAQPSPSEASVPAVASAAASEDTAANPFGASEDGQEASEAQSAPPSSGRKRNQSQIAATLGVYLGTKTDQTQKTVESIMHKKKREEDYSVEKCLDTVEAMEELTDEEKATAAGLFEKEIKRELFMKFKNHNVRLIWLRKEISKLE